MKDKIKKAIQSVAKKFPDGEKTSQWTESIKIALGDLGLSGGYEVLTNKVSSREKFQPEWLFDLTWYLGSDIGIKKLPLIVECEWLPHDEDLRHDFEKLLVAHAEIKVFIFEASSSNIEGKKEMLNKLKLNYAGSSDNQEDYIIACLDLDSSPYEFNFFELD